MHSFMFGAIACIVIPIAIVALIQLRGKHRAFDYERSLHEHFEGAERRGVRLAEAVGELTMRESYVRIRRIVSDAVEADPGRYQEVLRDQTKIEAKAVSTLHGMHAAARFRRWIADLTPADILYQRAYNRLRRHISAPVTGFEPSQDQVDALRIVPRSR